MDNVNIPVPNMALRRVLRGEPMRAIITERVNTMQMAYQAVVAKRTGLLASSARTEVQVATIGSQGPEWIGDLTIGGQGSRGTADYALSHEFGHNDDEGGGGYIPGAHDLNTVLAEIHDL